jgi:hypothetical protein
MSCFNSMSFFTGHLLDPYTSSADFMPELDPPEPCFYNDLQKRAAKECPIGETRCRLCATQCGAASTLLPVF